MEKTVKLFATLRDLTGKKTLNIPFEDGQTVRKLIDDLATLEPNLHNEIINANGEMTGLVHILVHGRNIDWLNGLDTTIKETDIVTLLPPSAGG
ncbi:MAG: ubiquitin-like small modifier protein 1 [Chloroflexota bacterium]